MQEVGGGAGQVKIANVTLPDTEEILVQVGAGGRYWEDGADTVVTAGDQTVVAAGGPRANTQSTGEGLCRKLWGIFLYFGVQALKFRRSG